MKYDMSKEKIKKEISEENILKFFSEAYTLESDALTEDLSVRWVTARRSDMLVDFFSNLRRDPEIESLLLGMISDLSTLLYEANKRLK